MPGSFLLRALLLPLLAVPSALPSLLFLPDSLLDAAEHAKIVQWHDRIAAAALIQEPEFSRHGGDHRASDRATGSLLVLPPGERRVPIVEGFRQHFVAAAGLPFKMDPRLRPSSLPPHIAKAVRHAVLAGPAIVPQRHAVLHILREASTDLRPISNKVNIALMPSTVLAIAGGVNTIFLAVVIDAIGWLDHTLVERFVYGFDIVGPVRDSGSYRSIASRSHADAVEALRAFHESAPAWNRAAHRRLRFSRWSGEQALEDARAVTAATRKERAKGVLIGPYASIDAMHAAIAQRFPERSYESVRPRVMLRFGIWQKGKLRAIDDGKSNGANAASTLVETVTTPSFAFPAIVARTAYVVALHSDIPLPALVSALCDLTMAYRTVPSAQPWFTCFGHLDTGRDPPAPSYYFLPGHNFGLASAVLNFNRYAETIAVVTATLGAVPVEHYYDDFIITDVFAGGDSATFFVHEIVQYVGIGRPRARGEVISSPELDPEKDQETGFVNTILGVRVDLSRVEHDGIVTACVTPERVQSILDFINECARRGRVTPTDAAHLRGKLGFCLSPAYAGIGRAATLPLAQRQYRDTTTALEPGSELDHSFEFFRALLPRLPRLRLEFDVTESTVPPLLVYTDAAFWWKKARADGTTCGTLHGRRPMGDLGAVVYDPVTGVVRVAYATPPWHLYGKLLPDKKTHIAFVETLAAISVYSTYPEIFRGRRVNHFVDNTVALSALVHGYSGKVELAKAVNVFYLQLTGLRTSVYFDYVPSKANIADLPSRGAPHEVAQHLHGFDVRTPDLLRVPDVNTWHAPLGEWIDAHIDA